MTIDREEFEGYLRIDKDELDNELIQQPTIFYKISHELELAISERDKAKQHMEIIDAQMDGEYRADFEDKGEKFTEAVIKNCILTDEEHQAALDHYNEKREQVGVLSALKEAFNQRSYMLRDLVSLAVANYYERETVGSSQNKGKNMKYEGTKDKMSSKRRKRVRGE